MPLRRQAMEGDNVTHFTARVFGHGLVEWTPERIDAYANGLLQTHLPTRRWTPRRGSECRVCCTAWPCGFVSWAEQWGRSLTRHEAHSHRHPLDDGAEGRAVLSASVWHPAVEAARL